MRLRHAERGLAILGLEQKGSAIGVPQNTRQSLPDEGVIVDQKNVHGDSHPETWQFSPRGWFSHSISKVRRSLKRCLLRLQIECPCSRDSAADPLDMHRSCQSEATLERDGWCLPGIDPIPIASDTGPGVQLDCGPAAFALRTTAFGHHPKRVLQSDFNRCSRWLCGRTTRCRRCLGNLLVLG